jgi:APA family basic amino acid/polyamine antiporter
VILFTDHIHLAERMLACLAAAATTPLHARRSVAWNMCLEITLSCAAVARGCASYLATMLGLAPDALRLSLGPLELDPAAVVLVAALTAILVKGTRESSLFNMAVSALNIASILFVLCAGFPQAHPANLTDDGFAPYGVRGVFAGAAVVFFAFIGAPGARSGMRRA